MPNLSSERLGQFYRVSWFIKFTWCVSCISGELINVWIQFRRLERFFSRIRLISLVGLNDNKLIFGRIEKNDALFFYSRGGL